MIAGAVLASRAALLGAYFLTATPEATPAPARVVVIRPETADLDLLEIANRTRGELAGASIEVGLVECPAADADCAELETPSVAASGVAAVVFTVRTDFETTSEVRVRAAGGALLVRRLIVTDPAAAAEAPAVTAVRVAELVRAALLEATEPRREPPAAPPTLPTLSFDFETPPLPVARERSTGWFIGGGGALLGSPAGLATAYGVMLRAGYVGVRWPNLTVAGLLAAQALGRDLRSADGKVETRQELGALELSWRWRWRAAWQPRVLMGIGAYHLQARGIASGWTTFPGAEGALWTALFSAGGGLVRSLPDGFSLFGDAQLVLLRPSPVIVYSDRRAGGGNPSLLLALGVQRIF